jgi:hypothetical protein
MRKPTFLYHGSSYPLKGDRLIPRQSRDLGKNPENEKNAVYATNVKRMAVIMALLTSKGVKTSTLDFGNRVAQGIVIKGWPKQEFVYLYTLPQESFYQSKAIKHQYVSLQSVKPVKIEKLRVADYLHLIRNVTSNESEEFKVKEIIHNGKISKLASDSGKFGWSEEVHLVSYQNKKYVLRVCKDVEKAKHYEKISSQLERYGFLPKLFGRRAHKVLYEYINGRDLRKKETRNVIRQVGRICACVNKLNGSEKVDTIVKRWIKKSKPVLSLEQYEGIRKLYLYFNKKLKPAIRMDAGDSNPENFRLRNGTVYLVDVDSICPFFRAYGLAKAYIKWFKEPIERAWFKEGYGSVSSSKFITEEYEDFMCLVFLINEIKYFAKHGSKDDKPNIKTRFEILDELLIKYKDIL